MKEEYQFVVTLRFGNYKLIDLISQLMLSISITAFLYSGIHAGGTEAKFYYVAATLVAISWSLIRVTTKKDSVPLYGIALGIAAVGWFYYESGNKFIAVFLLFAAVLEKQIKFPKEIGFDDSGITFNNFPKKHYQWKEVSNVVLKDGLLTIDYKSNKLFQKEVEEDVLPKIEKEFNEFCYAKVSGL